tara:strand:+ start:949 stop:1125 length:177 start_codon:yes stop_codon:yes gene_type:complete
LIEDGNFDIVAILVADHIYRMDLQQIIYFHIKKRADFTICALPVHLKEAAVFGVIEAK